MGGWRRSCAGMLICLGAVALAPGADSVDLWQRQRQQMVDTYVVGGGIQQPRVIEALRRTPRHEFVPRNVRDQAYLDMALPIGEQQTISSPFIVAFMTECIDPQPQDRVLEIGTGSGYQAAVLSRLVKHVYSIEIVESLGRRAERTLRQLRYENVSVRIGDGFQGWVEESPFDKIIVTCSPEQVPQPLVDQLREGGLMVVPVGERYQQTMYLLRKANGALQPESLRPTLFVPMTGRAESQRTVQPDAAHPVLVNGSFESPADDQGFVPGWYYQRQAQLRQDALAPDGDFCLVCQNQIPDRDSHLMQGLAVDGRVVSQLLLSAWVSTQGVTDLRGPQAGPRVVLTFYDAQRREVDAAWLGPWRGDTPWTQEQRRVRVPSAAREAIVRIGLFGATGQVTFDDIQLTVSMK